LFCGSGAVCCGLFFFFFQAEDGIRDFHVTGVQTCALPIFRVYDMLFDGDEDIRALPWSERRTRLERFLDRNPQPRCDLSPIIARSEERRVGKECRYRGSACTCEEKRREGVTRR